ncbi:hypothetical protein HUG10_21070 (plasmid) [Halorarum halophilum]|uniref:Uncharacterized protein n=1 Tax=Halorarum halophilum TaxID=2743090 RepID=A0A7D5KWA4_9EURY|nr:hypothetical protein [Halobaculum halophilum]QLG30080.1 hypothetical protein HUG10_21070 [Halobaculum halophilum]
MAFLETESDARIHLVGFPNLAEVELSIRPDDRDEKALFVSLSSEQVDELVDRLESMQEKVC